MRDVHVSPIDYASPSGLPKRPFTSIGLTVALTFLTGGLLAVLMLVIPHFEPIFRDFKTELPAFTKFALAFSRWTVRDYGWLWLLLVPAVVPIIVTQLTWHPMSREESRIRSLGLALIVVAVAFVIFAASVVALLLPMVALVQSVSSPQSTGR